MGNSLLQHRSAIYEHSDAEAQESVRVHSGRDAIEQGSGSEDAEGDRAVERGVHLGAVLVGWCGEGVGDGGALCNAGLLDSNERHRRQVDGGAAQEGERREGAGRRAVRGLDSARRARRPSGPGRARVPGGRRASHRSTHRPTHRPTQRPSARELGWRKVTTLIGTDNLGFR